MPPSVPRAAPASPAGLFFASVQVTHHDCGIRKLAWLRRYESTSKIIEFWRNRRAGRGRP